MQVQNIYAGKKIRQTILAVKDTMPFYLHSNTKYALDNYTRFTTVEEILREYVTMVNVRKKQGSFHLNLLNQVSTQMFNDDPLTLVDGVAVFDIDKFMLTDPLQLKTVDVVTRKYFLGNSIFEGIVSWASYKGDLAGYDPGPHAAIIDYEGLQEEREFYSPVHNDLENISSHLPDYRNVLLWVPTIILKNASPKNVDFYTSDIPGKYIVRIEGITKKGQCGSTYATFDVTR